MQLNHHGVEYLQLHMAKKNIVVVAVDEAHCIEDWLVAFVHTLPGITYNIISLRGKDFRTAFSKIGGLRAVTSVPFMALTATASSTTQKLISQSLHLENPVVVSCSLNRPNIYFSASSMKGYNVSACTCTAGMFSSLFIDIVSPGHFFQADLAGIAYWLRTLHSESIPKTLIFVQTKNTGCKLYNWLSQCASSKRSVGLYHASLTQATKSHLQDMFKQQSGLRCLVATVAFGMVQHLVCVYMYVPLAYKLGPFFVRGWMLVMLTW